MNRFEGNSEKITLYPLRIRFNQPHRVHGTARCLWQIVQNYHPAIVSARLGGWTLTQKLERDRTRCLSNHKHGLHLHENCTQRTPCWSQHTTNSRYVKLPGAEAPKYVGQDEHIRETRKNKHHGCLWEDENPNGRLSATPAVKIIKPCTV